MALRIVEKYCLALILSDGYILSRPQRGEYQLDRLESVYYTHIKPTLGGFQLGNIKAVDIQTLLNQKSTEYSYTIVKMIRQILSEVFQHAYTEGDILKNPMANVIMAKRSKFKQSGKC